MDKFILLPLIIPMLTGILLIFSWNYRKTQKFISLSSMTISLGVSIYLVQYSLNHDPFALTMGGWKAPFGISFVLDIFSAAMIFISALIVFCGGIFSLKMEDESKFSAGFLPLLSFLMMGVNGAFLTGDLFNLYVWYEVMLMSSFVLLALGCESDQLGGALKYTIINLISSLFFLSAMGLIYGKMGTLNMADIALRLSEAKPLAPELKSAFILVFIAFGVKSALFPLFFWLPLSYPHTSYTVSAIFAGLLTKVGVYSLIRCLTLFFGDNYGWIQQPLLVISGLTMLIGVFGAVSRSSMRNILSFHIVSQIGYMIFGLALFGELGLAAAIFYTIHHIAVKSNLFFAAGIVQHLRGSDKLSKMGDIYKEHPYFTLTFLIPALSLAGIPPLSGFFAKYTLLTAAIEQKHYLITFVAVIVGFLTLYSMVKIWSEGLWKKGNKSMHHEELHLLKIPFTLFAPVVLLSLFTLSMGFNSSTYFNMAQKAAKQLLGKSIYIESVLGKR